jgi:hypothetical protein
MNQFFANQNGQQVNGNGMGVYGQQQYWPGAYSYQAQPPVPQIPVMTNPMTEEEHKMLQVNNGFNVTRNKIDAIRDLCTHKHGGQITVFGREDGLCECSYCGKVWEMKDGLTREEVENMVLDMNSLIETIKTFILDASPDVARNLCMALGFIDLIPGLYEYAMNNKKKLTQVHGMNVNGSGAAAQTWNALYGLMGGGMPGFPTQGFYGQPQAQGWAAPVAPMGAPMQQTWAQPQQQFPAQAPAPGVPVAPMGAPMQQTWGPQFGGPAPAGSPVDRPVGVVVPNGPAPMGAPAATPGMVTSEQVATAGPAPMTQTAANVPPAAPVAAATETPAKTFKA